MIINKPYLFIEINDENFIFLIAMYNENLEFEILDSIVTKAEGIKNGKVTDVEASSKILKKNLDIIEDKIKFIFKNVIVINSQENFECINVSGFKKLNGSQVSNEDIFYLLNNLKKIILENNNQKTLIHLFNSNFILDKTVLSNLPIGLFGEFYNHHLTFFLLPKSEVKNIKLILNNCGLNIERIILKSFAEGVEIIKKKKTQDILITININKVKSNISIFDKLSFIYSENFNFGTDMILKDISKLCSLDIDTVKKIFADNRFDNYHEKNADEHLNKKYFKDSTFRKISVEHLKNIITARANELIEIIYKKNINLKHLNKSKQNIYVTFQDATIYESIKNTIRDIFDKNNKTVIMKVTQGEQLKSCLASVELIAKGWEKEAIPIIQSKKSTISRIFSFLFK